MNPGFGIAQSQVFPVQRTPWGARPENCATLQYGSNGVGMFQAHLLSRERALPLVEYEHREEENGQLYSLYHITVSPRYAHLSTEEVRLQAYTLPEPMQVDPPSLVQYSANWW